MTKRGIRRLVILVVALFVIAGGLGGAFLVRKGMIARQLERAREQGLALHHAGEHEAALPLLSRYAGRHKDDTEVLVAFAASRRAVPLPNNRHITQAVAFLRAALAIEPDNLAMHEALLEIYSEAGFLTELAELTERMLALDPSHRRALFARVGAMLALDRIDEAERIAEILTATAPEMLESHAVYATVRARSNAPVAEIVAYARSVGDRFTDQPAYFDWLSRLEWADGNNEAAAALARKAAAMTPSRGEDVARLVDWLRQLDREMTRSGRPSEDGQPRLSEIADALFARAIDDPALGPTLVLEAIKRAWWAGRTELAAQYLPRLSSPGLEGNPEAAAWGAFVAEFLAAPGQGDEERAIASLPGGWSTLVESLRLLRAARPEAALAMLNEYRPDSGELHAIARFLKGNAMQRIGDRRGAAGAFREAGETGGIDRDIAWKALGDLYMSMGMFEESEAAYRNIRAREAIPAMDRIDRVLTQVERVRDADTARRMLQALLDADESEPGNPAVLVRLSRAFIIAGMPEEGARRARALMEGGTPPDPIGLIGLCRSLQSVDSDLASELLAAFSDETDNPDVLYTRAASMAARGELADARALIESRIGGRSDSATLPYHRALVMLLDQHDRPGALAAMREMSDLYPESATAQLAVLSTISVWSELDLARAAVARLRGAVGDQSPTWRLFDARVRLADNPSTEALSGILLDLAAVLQQDPDDYDALVLSANAYRLIAARQREAGNENEVAGSLTLSSGFFNRAVGPASRAYAFRPYIEMLLDHGRTADANAVLDRFIAIEDIPPACRADRIDLLVRVRRWSDAIEDQAWIAATGVPETVLNLAELHARSGANREALRVVNGFLDEAPRGPDLVVRAAGILAQAREFDRALEVLATLPERSEAGERREITAGVLLEHRRADLALPFLTEAARDLGTIDAWIRAIQAAIAADQPETVASLLAEAKRAFPGAPELSVFDTGEPSRRFSQLVASSFGSEPTPEEQQLIAIASEHATGRIGDDELLTRLSAYSASNPTVFAAWRLRSAILAENRRYDEAIEVNRQAKSAMPDDPRPRRELARLLGLVGQTEQAIAEARLLSDMLRPDTFEPDILIAQLELSRNDHRAAVNRLTVHRARILAESAERPSEGLGAYALALAGVGDAAEIEALFSGRPIDADSPWTRLLLQAINTMPTEQNAFKRTWLQRINNEAVPYPAAESWLALARFSGDPEDARRAVRLAESMGSVTVPEWRWVLAQGQAFLGRLSEAEEHYRALLEEYPGSPGPVVRLSELLADQPARATDAIAFIDQSAEQLRQNNILSPDVRDWLEFQKARALNTAGRNADAVRTLEAILAREPRSARSAILLARWVLEQGDTRRATELIRSVTEPSLLDYRTMTEYDAIRARLN
jgi:tetratricopeptide (TPR) repeat protein